MTTKTKVQARAQELGCTLHILSESRGERGDLDCEVSAPDGFVFRGTDLHVLVGCRADDETKRDVWADLLSRMSDGIERCANPGCDVCDDATHDACSAGCNGGWFYPRGEDGNLTDSPYPCSAC